MFGHLHDYYLIVINIKVQPLVVKFKLPAYVNLCLLTLLEVVGAYAHFVINVPIEILNIVTLPHNTSIFLMPGQVTSRCKFHTLH